MNRLSTLAQTCREHPHSVGQTYWQHFRFSASFSLRLLGAAFTAMAHALIPAAYESTTSRSVEALYQRMQNQKNQSH